MSKSKVLRLVLFNVFAYLLLATSIVLDLCFEFHSETLSDFSAIMYPTVIKTAGFLVTIYVVFIEIYKERYSFKGMEKNHFPNTRVLFQIILFDIISGGDYVRYGTTNTYDEDGKEGVRIGELRYNDLTDNGTKAGVVLFDRREEKLWSEDMEGTATDEYMGKFFDMDANASHKWHSRTGYKTMTKLIGEQADLIAESDKWDNKLRMNQAQPAFSVGGVTDLFVDLFNWNLKNVAIHYNAKIVDHEDFDKWLSIMPVFQVDFINSDYGDFNNKVNAKITAYNQKLVEDLLTAN